MNYSLRKKRVYFIIINFWKLLIFHDKNIPKNWEKNFLLETKFSDKKKNYLMIINLPLKN